MVKSKFPKITFKTNKEIVNPFSEEKRLLKKGLLLLMLVMEVSVILSALSAISLPNINKWIKLSRIDEAKASLNLAAANCLQSLRTGNTMTSTDVAGAELSNDKLNTIGYKIKTEKNKCGEFQIEPINSS